MYGIYETWGADFIARSVDTRKVRAPVLTKKGRLLYWRRPEALN